MPIHITLGPIPCYAKPQSKHVYKAKKSIRVMLCACKEFQGKEMHVESWDF